MTDVPPLFILANDKVLARFIMLAASLRYFNYPNKVFVLPFDDNVRVLRSVAASLGYEVYDNSIPDVQAFARHLYDRDPPANPYPRCLGNLHKLAFLSYPGKAVYLDADIVVTTHPEVFNGVFAATGRGDGRLNIGYINTSPGGVYEENDESKPFLSKSQLICAGIMSKSEGVVSIDQVWHHFTEARIKLYHRIRRRGGHVDQPVWNFLVDTGFFDATDLIEGTKASRVTSPSQAGLSFAETGALSIGGRSVLLFHMAGPLLKSSQGCKFFWQGMLWEGMQILRHAGLPEWQEVLAATDTMR